MYDKIKKKVDLSQAGNTGRS